MPREKRKKGRVLLARVSICKSLIYQCVAGVVAICPRGLRARRFAQFDDFAAAAKIFGNSPVLVKRSMMMWSAESTGCNSTLGSPAMF